MPNLEHEFLAPVDSQSQAAAPRSIFEFERTGFAPISGPFGPGGRKTRELCRSGSHEGVTWLTAIAPTAMARQGLRYRPPRVDGSCGIGLQLIFPICIVRGAQPVFRSDSSHAFYGDFQNGALQNGLDTRR